MIKYLVLFFLPIILFAQERTLTFTIGPKALTPVSDLFTEYTHSAQLSDGWMIRGDSSATGKTNVNEGTEYVIWWPLAVDINANPRAQYKVVDQMWDSVRFEQTVNTHGVKEHYFLLDAVADTVLEFALSVSQLPTLESDGRITFGSGMPFMRAPTAVDAIDSNVVVDIEMTGPVSGLYTITYTVHVGDHPFPIDVDPTITVTDAPRASHSPFNGTYLTARNATASATWTTGHQQTGQDHAGGSVYRIHRGRGFFDMGVHDTDTMSISSVVLTLTSGNDTSAEDFTWGPYASHWDDASDDAGHIAFVGWATSGTYTNVIALATPVSTASFNATQVFTYNAAGIAIVDSSMDADGNHPIVFLSSHDINATQPGSSLNNYIHYTGNPETLVVTYTVVVPSGGDAGVRTTRSRGTVLAEPRSHEIPGDRHEQGKIIGATKYLP